MSIQTRAASTFPSPTDAFWDGWRAQYPCLARYTYLNSASIQPLPLPVAEALGEFVRAACEGNPEALYGMEVPGRLRATLARWLGCAPEALALTTSTSDGLIKAVNAIPWRAGDEVVIPRNEFPSVTYPFRMAETLGARLSFAGETGQPVTEEQVLAAVTPATRAAAFSWVSFSTGYRMDLGALARDLKARGVEYVLVDGMQGAGVWPARLAETAVDFFAFQGVKWMAGPNGIGALYLGPGVLEKVRDSCLSWYSVPACEEYAKLTDVDLQAFPTARRFDGGTPPWMPMVGVQAYLDALETAGIEGVAARVAHLMEALAGRLREAGLRTLLPAAGPGASSITLLEVPGASAAYERLRAAGVVVSLRMGRIRVSPHAFNATEDFDRLVAVLRGEK